MLFGESGVDVGAEGLLESVDADEACLWVAVVSSVDEDVGDKVGVVGVADGRSELSSVGRGIYYCIDPQLLNSLTAGCYFCTSPSNLVHLCSWHCPIQNCDLEKATHSL